MIIIIRVRTIVIMTMATIAIANIANLTTPVNA